MKEVLLISLIDELSTNKIKIAKVKLNCYLDIGTYLNIIKCLKIKGYIFESVKLSMRDGNWKILKKKYKKALGDCLFLVTKSSLVLQTDTIERLFKLYKK